MLLFCKTKVTFIYFKFKTSQHCCMVDHLSGPGPNCFLRDLRPACILLHIKKSWLREVTWGCMLSWPFIKLWFVTLRSADINHRIQHTLHSHTRASLQSRRELFPKSIFYMLYTISKLRNSKIQCFKSCTIWS